MKHMENSFEVKKTYRIEMKTYFDIHCKQIDSLYSLKSDGGYFISQTCLLELNPTFKIQHNNSTKELELKRKTF